MMCSVRCVTVTNQFKELFVCQYYHYTGIVVVNIVVLASSLAESYHYDSSVCLAAMYIRQMANETSALYVIHLETL